jgi:hypothetical protein
MEARATGNSLPGRPLGSWVVASPVRAMAALSERHEVRVRGRDSPIVFNADSEDGRLVIRQERDGKKSKDVCAITLSDPDELRAFFKGLRRIVSSLEHGDSVQEEPQASDATLVAQARQRNPQAFSAWSKQEEQEVKRRYEAGESVQSIARAHKRSPRAIELRLQRLGVLPVDNFS